MARLVFPSLLSTLRRIRDERKLDRAFNILTSIPGLGQVSTAAMLIEMPELGTLNRKHLRDALYMSAIVATRLNPDMKRKYTILRNTGKPAKVAITAVMRKLI
jgi:transposase